MKTTLLGENLLSLNQAAGRLPPGRSNMTYLRQQLIANERAREIACRLSEIRCGLG
jgi:hypothetical protein